MATATTGSSAPAHYWLVWSQIGTDATVVQAASKPKGSYVADLGETTRNITQLDQALLSAFASAPNGYDMPSKLSIPGIGQETLKGPGGIAGLLDAAPAAIQDTAENAAGGVMGLLTGSWLMGLLLCIAGGALVAFGLYQLAQVATVTDTPKAKLL